LIVQTAQLTVAHTGVIVSVNVNVEHLSRAHVSGEGRRLLHDNCACQRRVRVGRQVW
jgi:hypothetical protein